MSETRSLNLFCVGLPAVVTENFAQQLRARGIAAHCTSVSSMDALKSGCAEHGIDILLLNTDKGTIQADDAISLFERSNCDASIIGWGNPSILDSVRIGLRDVIQPNEGTRAILVILREFRDLLIRRHVAELEVRLEDATNQCSILMKSSKDAICYVHEGMHIRANAAYFELFDIPADEEIECVPMMDLVSRDFHKDLKRYLRVASHSSRDTFSLNATCQSTEDEQFTATLEFSSVTVDGENCVQIVVRKQAEQPLDTEAHPNRDAETGLYNSSYLQADLNELIDLQNSDGTAPHALFYIAVDSYLELRNIHGLAGADIIVRDIADLLRSNYEERGVLAKQGEYAFALSVPCETESAAEKIGEEIIALVAEHAFKTTIQFTQPTVSIGIAMSNKGHMINGQEFIDRAYRAYISAADSGNSIASYVAKEHAAIQHGSDDAEAISLIEYGLKHDRIEPRYQAMIHLATSKPEENFIVTPVIMDPNDESVALNKLKSTVDIGDKTVLIDHTIIKDITNHLANLGQRNTRAFIDISAASIRDINFSPRLKKLLELLKIPTKQIVFLLNDELVRGDLHSTRTFCESMKKMDVGVYLTKFGLKDDDLALTKQFELEGVIIHPQLSAELDKNDAKQQELRQMVQALHQQNLQSILYGIDSASALALCWSLNVDYAAGGFIHSPEREPRFDFSQYQ